RESALFPTPHSLASRRLHFPRGRCTLDRMRETQAIIERVRRISADLQQIDLSTDPSLSQLQPGHSLFAHLLENTQFTPYLREQWFPIAVGAARVVVELPPQQRYHPGQVVSLLTPVGRPIPLRANVQRVLLIAHDTLPTPFILLTQQLIANQVAVTLVLSGTALRYPLELLPPEIEVVQDRKSTRLNSSHVK